MEGRTGGWVNPVNPIPSSLEWGYRKSDRKTSQCLEFAKLYLDLSDSSEIWQVFLSDTILSTINLRPSHQQTESCPLWLLSGTFWLRLRTHPQCAQGRGRYRRQAPILAWAPDNLASCTYGPICSEKEKTILLKFIMITTNVIWCDPRGKCSWCTYFSAAWKYRTDLSQFHTPETEYEIRCLKIVYPSLKWKEYHTFLLCVKSQTLLNITIS